MSRLSSKHVVPVVLSVVIITGLILLGRFVPTPGKPAAHSANQRQPRSTLQLPGAAPISFEHPDYNEPSSMWVIVSKSRYLSDQSYAPASLVLPDVSRNTNKSQEEQSLRPEAAHALERMIADATKAGHNLFLASGYRSFSLQKTYYDNYVAAYGVEQADTFSAKPGSSEHQTGLAFDLADSSRTCYLEICFDTMPSGAWLAEHAYQYGFILRYPKDKTSITGYMYEPWHFRYVGEELANALRESGLTLDEALPYFESAH